ncbi:hypothetical protein AA958_05115 [Streptomyces sp. CNQ-509]|uniref:hypothetical protein n=1 Tax=unclassified Streptomyces TaxID=2593676 RepID=UPI00062DD0D7|nr:hypothetical protein [Streptomyces sp. CNQ-509]AKH81677.1 hypothetical protein AA958_05115 [Streptomyces sp. CNQ-509]
MVREGPRRSGRRTRVSARRRTFLGAAALAFAAPVLLPAAGPAYAADGPGSLPGPGPGAVPGAGDRGGPTKAECRTTVTGSTVTARCYNAGPYTDAVQLHIECARWWDPDVDGMRVRLDPAESGELTDRCWFDVAHAWISHEPIRDVPDG